MMSALMNIDQGDRSCGREPSAEAVAAPCANAEWLEPLPRTSRPDDALVDRHIGLLRRGRASAPLMFRPSPHV
jgi:hypothetical protein